MAASSSPEPVPQDAPFERFRRELPSPVPEHPLEHLLTERRARLFRQVLVRRIQRLAVVVEDCYDPHNATAVIRSCDAFGIHRIFITTGRSSFKINRRVCQGAHRYVDVQVHKSIETIYTTLRRESYRIMATDLRADAVVGPQHLRQHLEAGERLAVVFGCEGAGLSPAAIEGADGHFLLPMAGVSQSLNLSVSAATSLYALRGDALAADRPGDLSPSEQCAWFEHWLCAQHPAAAAASLKSGDWQPWGDPIGDRPGRMTAGVDRHGDDLDCLMATD